MLMAARVKTRLLPLLCLAVYIVLTTLGTFAGGIWAGVSMSFAAIAYAAASASERKFLIPSKDLICLCFLTLALMVGLSVLSPAPDAAWKQTVNCITIFLPLLLLFHPQVAAHALLPRFFVIIGATAIAGALALSVELFSGGMLLHSLRPDQSLSAYNRGFSYLIILAFPLAGGLWIFGQRTFATFLIAAVFIPACLTESRTAKLCLIAGLLAAALSYLRPIATRRVLNVVPFLVTVWPFAARYLFLNEQNFLEKIPTSWRVRVEIWDYMSYRIAERPILGWGPGTSHTLPFADPHGPNYVWGALFPAAHPHNAATQLWVELGIPGLVLGVIFALLTLRKTNHLPSALVPFAMGCWVAALCLSLLAYDFWTDSLTSCFAIAGFTFLLASTAARPSLDAA